MDNAIVLATPELDRMGERYQHLLWNRAKVTDHFVTDITWGVSYTEAAREFLSETMPRLWRLGRPDQVRCLFFFDN